MCDVGDLRVGEDFDYSLLSCDTAQPETIVNRVLEVLRVTLRGADGSSEMPLTNGEAARCCNM